MDKLIPIDYANPERPTVSGRELHKFLNIETPYAKWFGRMVEYGFTEGEDFVTLVGQKCPTNNPKNPVTERTDHQLTIPMAKELCMLQRNERGKQARRYFIAVEEQWNSPEAVMRRAILIADKKVKQLQKTNRMLLAENMELKEDAEYARAICLGNACRTTTEIAKDYGYSSAEKLNIVLHALGVQYKTSSGQWVLYAEHCGKGYTKTRKTKPITRSDGSVSVHSTTVWTEAGQRFIYKKLKEFRILPCNENHAELLNGSDVQGEQLTMDDLEGESEMKKTTMPDWCVAVKKAMIDHDDMTVTELAKETGFSRSHISQVVNGVLVPSENVQGAIEKCLNISGVVYRS